MISGWTSLTRRRCAFWLCLLVVLGLALMRPTHLMPSTGWDKANHALAFAVLTVLGCLSYPGRALRLLPGLFAYGVLIEVLQSLTGYRTGEAIDLAADAAGVALGWQVMAIARRFNGQPGGK
jgi:VanZ family protein